MQANNLPGYCTEFPVAGSSLCIPQGCDVYTVAANDTCYDIVQTNNGSLSVTQMISWNPNINRDCSNLNQLEGYQICLRLVTTFCILRFIDLLSSKILTSHLSSYPGTPQAVATSATATITSLAA
jgi:hypothetical protein